MGFFETLYYEIIKKEKNIEIRKYDNFSLATTITKMNRRYDNGFSKVFNYISGNNERNEKINMTTPVISEFKEDKFSTSFVIPTKVRSNIPKPNSDNVIIENFEDIYMVCIKFSGRWTDKNFDKQNALILDFIEKNKLVIKSKMYLFRYNPPFTPSFVRRNEIAYFIERI